MFATRILIPRPHGPAKRWGTATAAPPRLRLRVQEVIRETPEAVTLVLQTLEAKPLAFRAGQYLTHCFEIDGETHKRAYSISAAEGGTLACTIQSVPGGVVSGFVLSRLQPGHEYTALGPSGDFVLPASPTAPLAMLAAGSGITPVISLIETALARAPDRRITLVYASRDAAHTLFAARLEALAARHAGLRVIPVHSRPAARWKGEKGRLDGARAAQLLAADAQTEVFLCGPQPLMEATQAALLAGGVPAGQIHRERFLPAPRHTRSGPTEPQPIVFRRSGRTVQQRPGETVLDAGLREGVRLPFSCTVGGCAACKIQVIEGEVALDEPNCLSADERAQGYTLSCSAQALGPCVIDA